MATTAASTTAPEPSLLGASTRPTTVSNAWGSLVDEPSESRLICEAGEDGIVRTTTAVDRQNTAVPWAGGCLSVDGMALS